MHLQRFSRSTSIQCVAYRSQANGTGYEHKHQSMERQGCRWSEHCRTAQLSKGQCHHNGPLFSRRIIHEALGEWKSLTRWLSGRLGLDCATNFGLLDAGLLPGNAQLWIEAWLSLPRATMEDPCLEESTCWAVEKEDAIQRLCVDGLLRNDVVWQNTGQTIEGLYFVCYWNRKIWNVRQEIGTNLCSIFQCYGKFLQTLNYND